MSIVFLMATILEYLQTPNKLVGIILAMLGFAFSILAKKITKVARKTDSPKSNDPIYLIVLALSLVLMLVGLIITIF